MSLRRTLSRRRLVAAGLAALALAGAGQALAADAVDPTPPPGTVKLTNVTVRITPTQITQGTRDEIAFTVEVASRRLAHSTLTLTLPRPWLDASVTDGTPVAVVPRTGSGPSPRVKVRRSDRVVRFAFTKARRGDTGRFTVSDRSLPSGTYRARMRMVSTGAVSTATLSVVVLPLPAPPPQP